jgi:serine phosphatase RsbU (regulator of sigma subunit)
LNPYNGVWVAGIDLVDRQVSARTLEDMARVLGSCPEAQTGKMLEKHRLDVLIAKGPPQGRVATEASDEPTITPARVPKPARDRTDFHLAKSQFIKMLSRPPRLEGYQLVMHYEPYSVIPRNFYDFISLDRNRLLIAIGDISGNGPGAALMAAQVMRALRRLGAMRAELIDLVASLNDELRLDLVHGTSLSLFAAVLNLPFNSLTCLSLGCRPAALINPRRDLSLQQIFTDGALLGRVHGQRFRDTLRPISIQLRPGDLVVLSTDGLALGHNPRDAAAGHLAVMGSCLSRADRPFGTLLEQVVAEAKQGYHGTISEDLTMVGIRVKTGDEPQTGRFVSAPTPTVRVAMPSTRKR